MIIVRDRVVVHQCASLRPRATLSEMDKSASVSKSSYKSARRGANGPIDKQDRPERGKIIKLRLRYIVKRDVYSSRYSTNYRTSDCARDN